MQTVKSPPARVRRAPTARSRAWVWLSVLVVVGLVATGLVWLLNDDGPTVEPSATPTPPVVTTQPVVTTAPVPTTTPDLMTPDLMRSRTPMPSIEALIEATYAVETPATRTDVRDTDAVYAFRTPDVIHSEYLSVDGDVTLKGTSTDTIRFNPPVRSLTRLGPPLVSGMVVAVPVQYEYSFGSKTGFDLFRVEEVDGGYLIAEQAMFHARIPIDPDVERFVAEDAAGLLTTYITSWNEGDEVASQASFTADGAIWEGWNEPERQVHQGDDLAAFIASGSWLDVAAPPEEAVVAGPFLVVANRLPIGADDSDGISLFMFEDGKIELQVFHQ